MEAPVQAVAVFLASNDSSYVTGSVQNVTGLYLKLRCISCYLDCQLDGKKGSNFTYTLFIGYKFEKMQRYLRGCRRITHWLSTPTTGGVIVGEAATVSRGTALDCQGKLDCYERPPAIRLLIDVFCSCIDKGLVLARGQGLLCIRETYIRMPCRKILYAPGSTL